ncbi:hypothetical protein R1sor_018491 [Riccia sorocarpa]|uniref:Uncharacterized protein n=1 Tax=Riccia sorocarpa TaxID=122646 RepID=A0ABD3ID47_9MARC
MAEADDSVTSRPEGESPPIETSEGPRHSGGDVVTPESRSSSVVKRGILRSPLSKGIKLNLFGKEGDSGESGERFRAQAERIFMLEQPESVHLCASEVGEREGEEGIVRSNPFAMSELGQSSQDAPSPEGSNSGRKDQHFSNLEEVSDRDTAPAESPKSGGVLHSVNFLLITSFHTH